MCLLSFVPTSLDVVAFAFVVAGQVRFVAWPDVFMSIFMFMCIVLEVLAFEDIAVFF